MKKLNFFIVVILFITCIPNYSQTLRANWDKREELKELENAFIKALSLLESKKYDEYTRFIHKPSIIEQNTPEKLEAYSKWIGENASQFIELYTTLLKTEPNYLKYDYGQKPEDIDETVVFMASGSWGYGARASDRIGGRWYEQ
jgi:hypothetical protein